MTERTTTQAKMANDLTPRKTMIVLVIVVGCFAVLWPKVFHPMLVGNVQHHIKPSPIDRTSGCCDVISVTDVNTIKLMSELCKNIIKPEDEQDEKGRPLNNKQIISKCRSIVLETCGIDMAAVLQEQVRLGQKGVSQILDEVRSLNGSLCLKYNFGVAPWRLGVPHRITVKVLADNVRQERPPHLRSEMVHPAFRERGRAIPETVEAASRPAPTPSRPPPKIVEGRPGPLPGMRPTMGGPGHVVPPPKQGSGSMGLIMPIYTIGIVIFFTYTVMKIVFKKQPDSVGGTLYPPVDPDRSFRKEVFESSDRLTGNGNSHQRDGSRDGVKSKIGDVELDQLRTRLRETELAMERIVEQMAKVPFPIQETVGNGNAVKPQEPSVKIMGMEMTASHEGGKKWSRPESPVLPSAPPLVEPEQPPQEIFLEGALPAQSQLLVTDSATTEQEPSTNDDTPVVLSGKMTLSLISLDSTGEDSTETVEDAGHETEPLSKDQLKQAIDEIIEQARSISEEVEAAKEHLVEDEEVPSEEEELEDEEIEEYEASEEEDIPNEVRGVDQDINNVIEDLDKIVTNNSGETSEEEIDDEEIEVEEIIEYVEEEEEEEDDSEESEEPKINGIVPE